MSEQDQTPAVSRCGGTGVFNTACDKPKHLRAVDAKGRDRVGQTWCAWVCDNCGGQGITTWD